MDAAGKQCIYISHASCWPYDRFAETATKLTNIILDYPGRLDTQKISPTEHFISNTQPDLNQ